MSTGSPPGHDPESSAVTVPMARVVLAGTIGWAVIGLALLVVPDWHAGPRSWWPWCAAAGVGLGLLGLGYLGRGRGNASGG
ncbi:MAG: DUF2530 domain-containing protein [Dermatophilaceae bacterium]